MDLETTRHNKLVEEPRAVELFNRKNPQSMINVLPVELGEKMFRLVKQEHLGMDEMDLRALIKPSPTLNKLRMSLWYEYDRAVNSGRRIEARRIYAGICSTDTFYKQYCKENNIAWLLTPISSYATSMEEALEFSISQLRKMLEANLFLDNGQLDTKTANVIIKVHQILDQRVHGAITQKMELKSLVVQRNMGSKDPDNGKSIDEAIREAESKLIQNRKIVEVDYVPTED